MKKLKKLICLILVLAFSVTFVGCDAKIKDVSLKKDTFATEYLVGDTADTTKIALVATYSDKTIKEIANADLTIGTVDTSTVGEKELEIKWNEYTVKVKYTVYNTLDQMYEISGFEDPEFIANYRAVTSMTDAEYNALEESDKQTVFFDRTKTYKVGDDNAFVFLPQIEAVVSTTKTITLNQYVSDVKIYQKVNENWTLIYDNTATETLTSNLVTVNNIKQEFDFADAAVGKIFKLSVRPHYLTEEQNDAENEEYIEAIEFEFEVVDGYNVYTAKQLAVMNNKTDYWDNFKSENGLTGIDPNAIVLHNNFTITDDLIPASMKYMRNDGKSLPEDADDSIYNTMELQMTIFSHYEGENQSFSIYGNYATIDASKVSRVVDAVAAQNSNVAHVALFGFNDDNNGGNPYDHANATYNVYDLSTIGNLKRAENIVNANGGLQGINSAANLNIDNYISRAFESIYCLHETNGTHNKVAKLNNVKNYDSYAQMVYSHGYNKIEITNSEMLQAGGPLVILGHFKDGSNVENYGTLIVDENSRLESWVNGQETWFVRTNAMSVAMQLIGLGQLVRGYTSNAKTMTKTEGNYTYVNFICLVMDAGNPLTPESEVNGYVKIGETVPFDEYVNPTASEESTYPSNVLATIDSLNSGMGKFAPVFQSSAGGFACVGGTEDAPTLNNAFAGTPFESINNTNFASGDYLYIYNPLNANARLGVVLGYYDVQA